jgi:hypothetical protein
LVGVLVAVVVAHHVIRSLIELVLLAQVFGLDLLHDLVVGCAHDGRLDRARLQLVEIQVLPCLGNHLEDVEVLLLAQLDQVPELGRPPLLSVGCTIVYPLADHQAFLLGKSIKILLRQWIGPFTLTHLRQFIGGLWLHLPNNLLFSELLSLQLLLGHGLSNFLDVIEALFLIEWLIRHVILPLQLS